MNEMLRKSGIEIIGEMPWGAHLCLFYQTKEDLMNILVPYFKAGLENNELCMWVTSEPSEVNEAKRALKKAIPDIDLYLEKGQIGIAPPAHEYVNEGDFDSERAINLWAKKLNSALAGGYEGLRTTGDISWLVKVDWNNLINYEKKIDAFIAKRHTITLCPYFLDMYNSAEIIDLVTTHQFSLIKRRGKWELVESSRRKETEKIQILRENEFRTLAENSPDVIARFDRQKRYIYINPAGSASGYPPEEIIGKTSSELGIDPETVKLWEEHIENAFTTGKPEEIEFNYKSPQGKKYYFNTRIVPEFVDGEVISALAISRDITNVKKAEARSKETLDNLEKLVEERTLELEKAYTSLKESEKGLAEAQKMAHIGNWEWDIAADKAYWSDEMYHIFGRDPKKSAPPYNEYLSYIHPDDRDYFDNATRKAVNGKPYSIEYRIVRANGEERTIHMQSHVIFDEKNIAVRIKGIIQDITERKKAEKALVNLEIARKKEIHHRIKNNLQVISSLLDLQAEYFSNRQCVKNSDVLDAFRESQDRITSIALIHEELHESEGDNTLYFSPYLEKLIENLFQTYNLGNADIALYMDLEENIFFDMDTAVPLGIIVNELVSNSLKHAFPGRNKGEIQIKLFKEERAGEEKAKNELSSNEEKITGKNTKGTRYTLIVSDDGAGIPEKISLENSDTLGLQLVSILVDQLDGEIELKRDRGTEFIIRINVQQGFENLRLIEQNQRSQIP